MLCDFLLRQQKKREAMLLVENDLQRFPHSPVLKRLKSEMLRKRSAKSAFCLLKES